MFSIVIPVHRLVYLAQAVRSIVDQEPRDLLDELLLVTDGFSDADLPLPAEVRDDPRVRVVSISDGMPTPAATKWNAGLDAVTSPWLILFADDDLLGEAALSALAAAHEREPDAAVLRLRQWQIDGNGDVIQ